MVPTDSIDRRVLARNSSKRARSVGGDGPRSNLVAIVSVPSSKTQVKCSTLPNVVRDLGHLHIDDRGVERNALAVFMEIRQKLRKRDSWDASG